MTVQEHVLQLVGTMACIYQKKSSISSVCDGGTIFAFEVSTKENTIITGTKSRKVVVMPLIK